MAAERIQNVSPHKYAWTETVSILAIIKILVLQMPFVLHLIMPQPVNVHHICRKETHIPFAFHQKNLENRWFVRLTQIVLMDYLALMKDALTRAWKYGLVTQVQSAELLTLLRCEQWSVHVPTGGFQMS